MPWYFPLALPSIERTRRVQQPRPIDSKRGGGVCAASDAALSVSTAASMKTFIENLVGWIG
jgi:hypothetical protein